MDRVSTAHVCPSFSLLTTGSSWSVNCRFPAKQRRMLPCTVQNCLDQDFLSAPASLKHLVRYPLCRTCEVANAADFVHVGARLQHGRWVAIIISTGRKDDERLDTNNLMIAGDRVVGKWDRLESLDRTLHLQLGHAVFPQSIAWLTSIKHVRLIQPQATEHLFRAERACCCGPVRLTWIWAGRGEFLARTLC